MIVMFVALAIVATVVLYAVYQAYVEHRYQQRRRALWREIERLLGPEKMAHLLATFRAVEVELRDHVIPAMESFAASMATLTKRWNDSAQVISDRSGEPVYVPKKGR